MRHIVLLALVALSTACTGTPGTTVVLRRADDGQLGFHSVTEAFPGSARFECHASETGRCHYAVFGGACGGLTAAFGDRIVRCAETASPRLQFDLQVGEQRDVSDLPLDFRHCVREQSGPLTAACLGQRVG
ncbi:hypothetical protein H4F99_09290 [Lysobacter sp. SG-8]|uniref:Secreted protein n=1 Tax=Marilutibacter penaei TaxID=2759900 RepID=A0A7W3YF07_9GAMM|nr:hypothetical protein [Lysobacter penaei]MBB1088682.1 hypothetical protein [Lysobacter penaei]